MEQELAYLVEDAKLCSRITRFTFVGHQTCTSLGFVETLLASNAAN
jgi:hypothetical protein